MRTLGWRQIGGGKDSSRDATGAQQEAIVAEQGRHESSDLARAVERWSPMHTRNPIAHRCQARLISCRALLLGTALAAALSLLVVPRANAFTLNEFLVILSAYKNTLGVLCPAETPNPEAIAVLRSALAASAPTATLVVGTAGPDTLVGTDGPDIIFGFGGNDVISGLGGDDFICGGPGDDILIGGPGDDLLIGAPGTDLLFPDERPLPQTTADCKDNGWQQYGIFKNQGDCVSFVATGGRNPGAGR